MDSYPRKSLAGVSNRQGRELPKGLPRGLPGLLGTVCRPVRFGYQGLDHRFTGDSDHDDTSRPRSYWVARPDSKEGFDAYIYCSTRSLARSGDLVDCVRVGSDRARPRLRSNALWPSTVGRVALGRRGAGHQAGSVLGCRRHTPLDLHAGESPRLGSAHADRSIGDARRNHDRG